MNPSDQLRQLAQAFKLTHPCAALRLTALAVAVQRLEATVDDLTAEAMEQQDIDRDAAARVGFRPRHADAMDHLRRLATPYGSFEALRDPAWFDRGEYLDKRKGESA